MGSLQEVQAVGGSMKLIVTGSRSLDHINWIPVINGVWVTLVRHMGYDMSGIISGGAKGPDTDAETFAKSNDIPLQVFLPDWEQHGKAAGPIRNAKMAAEGDILLAIWDGGSRGTQNTIHLFEMKLRPCIKVIVTLPEGDNNDHASQDV
jgi:hypothetical protein